MIKRKLFSSLKKHLSQPEISLIVGPRQAGKTTLMQLLQQTLDQKGRPSLFLNYDIELDRPFFQSQQALLNKIKLEIGERQGVVFLDEIQRKKNAGLFLKGLYDMDLPYKFVVSGSGSLELKEKIHESLAGRKRVFPLDTLSFEEFVNYQTNYRYQQNLSWFLSLHPEKTQQLLLEYLRFGGYPRVVLAETAQEKRLVLNEIYRSYLERDIGYLGVDKLEAFQQLLELLANQTGQLTNYQQLANSLDISLQTVKKYLWYAEKTFVIKKVRPFYQNKRKTIVKSPLYYFRDLGLRNFVLGNLAAEPSQTEAGLLFENFIFLLLWNEFKFLPQQIKFWRTKYGAEMDFVIQQAQQIIGIEAKYQELKRPQISKSVHSFVKSCQPTQVIVANLSLNRSQNIEEVVVQFKPYYYLVVRG